MTETILDLMTDYGVAILFVVTFLSCLCVPIPSSLMMLAGGSFAATGDLNTTATVAAAYTGAVAGDNTGYLLARNFGTRITGWIDANPKRARLRDSAKSYMDQKGPISIFLSCWLVAPLGPYANLVSGMTRFNWARFALWGALGEVFWVGIYVGLGYSFSDQITTLAGMLGNISGLIVALARHLSARAVAMACERGGPLNDNRPPRASFQGLHCAPISRDFCIRLKAADHYNLVKGHNFSRAFKVI